MTRLIRVVAGLGLAGVVAAGCSTAPSEGSGSPESPQSAPLSEVEEQGEAGSLPHSGAPAVTEPLPVSALPQDPCRTFTRDQLVEALGEDAPEGERDDIETGPWCSWQDSETGAAIFVNYAVTTREGLSGLYRNVKPVAAVWREIPSIGGFPAVAFQVTGEEVSCSVNVGLDDEYTVGVAVAPGRERGGDACALSERLAETATANLREGVGP
ncbi:DUF3558 domain-containing protein [Saccharomonospora azurea]|uniref:DUF3558 domain-containing protein n=1 Tax=Saccharomonospora azurea TaxID=40988 RepID=UPI0002400DA7|nr:DUF3558 domain-containing protein [Saccharomonospora azurea]EHK87353.1 hypothetical protein SZMC14600_10798 [Saccharomonospora azurea SZMC 14600]